jgi:phage recombination protein Bet
MATAETKPATETKSAVKPLNLPAIANPRLPYHPAIKEKFGIDQAGWRALVEAIFPTATSIDSVIMALSYCKARNLDPFKRNVHIVPVWNKQLGRLVDTVWPGIGELRTTAFRTKEYAGRSDTLFGTDITQQIGSKTITFPEWAQVTVYRIIKDQRVAFAGPRVYWIETYATVKRDDDTPNEMWSNRPRGQIDKCAEAAALRGAFPEECGGDYIPEEVQHQRGGPVVNEGTPAPRKLEDLTERLTERLTATNNGNGEEHAEEHAEETAETSESIEHAEETQSPSFDADTFFANLSDELGNADAILPLTAIASRYLDSAPDDETKALVTKMCDDRRNEIRAKRGDKVSTKGGA